MNKPVAASVAIVIIAFAISVFYYPVMPESMASHWGFSGSPDAYSQKLPTLFFVPLLLTAMLALFLVIPRIDPLASNIKKFRKHFDYFVAAILAFMLYLQLIIIAQNLGYFFNFGMALSPAFAALFFFSGNLLGKAEKNWTIGIRTPWTMSSENVWKKTHSIGSKLFKIAGIICLLGLFFPNLVLAFVIAPVIAFSAFLVIYSFLEYRKEQKSKERNAKESNKMNAKQSKKKNAKKSLERNAKKKGKTQNSARNSKKAPMPGKKPKRKKFK